MRLFTEKDMRLGTFTTMYARRRGEKQELPYVEQMKHCLNAGFDVQSLCTYYSLKPERNAEIAADDWQSRIDVLACEAKRLGVDFSQSHAPGGVEPFIKQLRPSGEELERYKELFSRAIVASSMLGIKWMSVHPFSDNINCEYDNDVQWRSNYEFYAPFVEMGRKYGVGLAFENMARFDKYSMLKRPYCLSADELCDLCDRFGDEYVGVTWDFGHARMMMNDQREPLCKIGKRLKATHVQDNKGDRDAHLIPFIGGNVQWEKIMPVLTEIGYEGDFVFEAHRYSQDIPEELWEEAGRLAHEIGVYCLSLANK